MAATMISTTFSKNKYLTANTDIVARQMMSDIVDDLNGITSAGTKTGSTLTATEQRGFVHQTKLTLAAMPLAISNSNVGGGNLIYTFPEGRILLLGALGSVAFTTTSVLSSTLNTGVTINWGLGSVITAAQASGTLTTTEVDMLPTTNADQDGRRFAL